MGITDMFFLAFVSLYSVIYINMFIYSDKQESDLKIKSNRLTATNDFWNLYSQDQLREVKKKKTNLKTLALLLQAEVVPFASIETFANGNTRCSVLYPMYRLSRHLKKIKTNRRMKTGELCVLFEFVLFPRSTALSTVGIMVIVWKEFLEFYEIVHLISVKCKPECFIGNKQTRRAVALGSNFLKCKYMLYCYFYSLELMPFRID